MKSGKGSEVGTTDGISNHNDNINNDNNSNINSNSNSNINSNSNCNNYNDNNDNNDNNDDNDSNDNDNSRSSNNNKNNNENKEQTSIAATDSQNIASPRVWFRLSMLFTLLLLVDPLFNVCAMSWICVAQTTALSIWPSLCAFLCLSVCCDILYSVIHNPYSTGLFLACMAVGWWWMSGVASFCMTSLGLVGFTCVWMTGQPLLFNLAAHYKSQTKETKGKGHTNRGTC